MSWKAWLADGRIETHRPVRAEIDAHRQAAERSLARAYLTYGELGQDAVLIRNLEQGGWSTAKSPRLPPTLSGALRARDGTSLPPLRQPRLQRPRPRNRRQRDRGLRWRDRR